MTEEIGMAREPYRKRDWTGNGMRKLLKAADQLMNLQSDEARNYVPALILLGKIQTLSEVNIKRFFELKKSNSGYSFEQIQFWLAERICGRIS